MLVLYLEINNFEYRLVEVFQRKLHVNIAGIFSPQEKQFTIILELLGDNRLNTLTADERRSLAFLKKNEKRSSFSPGCVGGKSHDVSISFSRSCWDGDRGRC